MDLLRDDGIGYGLRRRAAFRRHLSTLLARASRTIYATEFMRMFEHYWFRSRKDEKLAANQVFALKDTDDWSTKYFTPGAREQRDRLSFLGLNT